MARTAMSPASHFVATALLHLPSRVIGRVGPDHQAGGCVTTVIERTAIYLTTYRSHPVSVGVVDLFAGDHLFLSNFYSFSVTI
ncbi:hypothetical protein [Microbispora sp. NBRC 16548]|uniref:hypothetical protein n=1 Tax=Microbispora sp. NBRC 16548 TaxID=3030994 RepID=UPI0025556FE8|nr:hypothetical protein [Microbispora sp. NBRC 16548]